MSSLWGRSVLLLLCSCATTVILQGKMSNILPNKIVSFLVFWTFFGFCRILYVRVPLMIVMALGSWKGVLADMEIETWMAQQREDHQHADAKTTAFPWRKDRWIQAVSAVPWRENFHWSSFYSWQKCNNKNRSSEVSNWKEDNSNITLVERQHWLILLLFLLVNRSFA